jgi:multimeric flavodoxin WrbA
LIAGISETRTHGNIFEEKIMKVLAINSSPRMERGNTALILEPFLEGLSEGGAEVDLFYTRTLKIDPCLGCFSC